MRTLSTAQDKILSRPGHSVHLRIDIKDSGGTFRRWDTLLGHDWQVSAEWGEELDEPGLNATVVLHYRRYVDSASPYTTGTRISGYLGLYRELRIYTAVMADEAGQPASGDWVLMFDGRIDKVDIDDSTVTLQCRDKITALIQDRWREEDGLVGSTSGTAMETFIQTILTEGLGGSAPTLYTPTSPLFNIIQYNVEAQPIFEAIRDVYLFIGWDCRPKYRDSSGLFELTLYDPDRAIASTMYTFSADRYRAIDGLGIDINDIRNVVEVYYWDGTTTNGTKPIPLSVTRSDATSITNYGRRWMQITEAQTSGIDTQAELEAFADAILADLKDPVMDFSLTMPYFWPVEINDYYEFEPDGLRFSASQDLAVEGYRHRIDDTGATTQLTVSGKPKSGRQVWLGRESRPGQLPTHPTLTPETPTVTATAGPIGVLVKTDWSTYGEFDMVQLHRSSTPSFVPSASTMIGFLRGSRYYDQVDDLNTVYYKAISLDRTGNASVTSSEISTAATGLTRDLLHPSLTTGVGVRATTDQTLGTSPDRVEWDTVVWGSSSMFDNGNDAITIPYNGVYHVEVGIYPNVGAEFTTIRVRVYVDATTVIMDSGIRSLADEPVLMSADVLVSAADNLTVEIDYTGTTPTLESDSCYFTVRPTTIGA